LAQYIAEGQEWTRAFLDDPQIAAQLPMIEMQKLSRAKGEAACRNADHDMVATMMMWLLKAREEDAYDPQYALIPNEWAEDDVGIMSTWRRYLSDPVTAPHKNILVLIDSDEIDDEFTKGISLVRKGECLMPLAMVDQCVELKMIDPSRILYKYDPAYLFLAVEQLGPKLSEEADLEKRNAAIAVAFMEIMAQESAKQTEFSQEQLNLCRAFILKYIYQDIWKHMENGERFHEAARSCYQTIPDLVNKSFESIERIQKLRDSCSKKREMEEETPVTGAKAARVVPENQESNYQT